jgi:superfamily II DNA or RNA helicase
MLKDIKWEDEYLSGSEDEPLQFYIDALTNSNHLDLLLGYFSSAAIHVLSSAFANFIFRGGKVRLIINNFLSSKDKEAIQDGLNKKVPANLLNLNDIEELRKGLDSYGEHFFNCLSWLISNDRIEIRIIRPKGRKGIAHYKSGIFSDGVNEISYRSSCNFTAYGLLENLEELHSFPSWEDEKSKRKVEKLKTYFEKIFSGQANFVEYLEAAEIIENIQKKFGDKNLEELIVDEKELLKKKSEVFNNKKLKESYNRTLDDLKNIEEEINKPKFPNNSEPRPYQVEAFKSWKDHNCQGVFAMATGTGKTITALNCLLEEYKKHGKYQAIIVVPTVSLVDQWKEECHNFNFDNVIVVNSRVKWADSISFINTASKFIDQSFIIIVTYATVYRNEFFSYLRKLPKETLFIADEAHNLGSSKVSKRLPEIHFSKRIGLSATPDRKYDDLGNLAIQNFFNDSPPYCYNFSMEEAIKQERLCKYAYYPYLVSLNEVELEEYIKISRQLIQYFDFEHGKYKSSPQVEALLLKRKRIIHKASNKLPEFEKIVTNEFKKRGNLKYTLVYVPEGIEPNYDNIDYSIEDEEDRRLINKYSRIVSLMDSSVLVKQFTGGTVDRKKVLKDFENGNIHVLTSMKCLDEGVDIPRAELAIFCSSTGNPRQFIQRRGRILRNHDDKTYATIYDLVVFPGIHENSPSYKMEKSLFTSELERVKDFSKMAINKMDTYEALKPALDYFNISLYNI